MKLQSEKADILVPDAAPLEGALRRTTHLAVGAHQDDLEIMAYSGITACFGDPSQWFSGVVVTNGAGSPRAGVYAGTTDEEMQEIRIREQRKAASIGEYAAVIQLGYPSSQVKDPRNDTVAGDILEVLRATTPRIVYLHNLADKHDTHVATTLRSIEALRELRGEFEPEQVLGCEVWRDLDWMVQSDKVILSASAFPNLSAALLGVFDSQISGGKRYDLATWGRRLSHATFSESHETDADTALIYAVDLTELVRDPDRSPLDHMVHYIDRFRDEVASRVEKFARE